MTIYTRQGDKGYTRIIGGVKLPKDHPLLEVLGSLDELNAYIGYVKSICSYEKIRGILSEVQIDLLRLSTELACIYSPAIGRKCKAIDEGDVSRIERYIDEYEAQLMPLNKFLVIGGSGFSSLLHLVRTICRRVERRAVTLFREENIEGHKFVIPYLNRISDLFFVLARYINLLEGVKEEYWEA